MTSERLGYLCACAVAISLCLENFMEIESLWRWFWPFVALAFLADIFRLFDKKAI